MGACSSSASVEMETTTASVNKGGGGGGGVHIGTCMPRVPDEEELLAGRIYFLVPLSHSDTPLSLPLLCDLAVKAGSALPNPNNNRYYGQGKKAADKRR
ncbi:hypothetical protein glysoja_003772 [Glycine soja]|nr:hypothetical protein glysoja_003772 [Glycine soja]